MDIKDIRKLSEEDLLKKLTEIKEELFSLRFQAATGNLEKPHRVKQLRHAVARIKTVLRERELEKMNKGEQK